MRRLEQLRKAASILDYGLLAGSSEAWVEVNPELTRLVEVGCSPLLDPGFWELIARGAGLGEVLASLESTAASATEDETEATT